MRVNFGMCLAAAVVATSGIANTQAALINETVAHDTHMNARNDNLDSNFGASPQVIVGGTTTANDFQVPLFRWTLSTVPANHVAITNGTITLNVTQENFINGTDQVAVHYIKPSNAGWIEGDDGAGSPNADGEPTWNNRVHPGTAWTGGAGLGNDAGGGASGYDTAFHTFTYNGESQITIPVAMSVLNDWIANPGNNAGILMRQITMDSGERLLRFHSRENNTSLSLAAVLSFETQLVPEPSSLSLFVFGTIGLLSRRRRAC